MTSTSSSTAGWDLKDLVAWQVSMDFAEAVYQATRTFPTDERFGLRMQLRRAAVSVSANVAEGHGRSSRREYARFVLIARGSLKEAETLLLLSVRLGFMRNDIAEDLLSIAERINRLLTGLRKRLQS
jgi:four helix bundle protein